MVRNSSAARAMSDSLPARRSPASPSSPGRLTLHQMAWGVSETITPLLVAVALSNGQYTLWLILASLAMAAAVAYRAVERAIGDRDGVAGAEAIAPRDLE
jgi:hypothetical protein